jgi:P27 family predicted phage terminase small subunit
MPPPRKPTSFKVLSGSAAHDPQRINKAEPKLELAELEPPPGLTIEARKEWKRIVPILFGTMKVLTDADRSVLVGYCAAFGSLVWAEKILAKEGRLIPVYAMQPGTQIPLMIEGRPLIVDYKRHPATNILKESMAALRGYAQIFGLSPADRSRVAAQDAGKKVDPMFELLQGGQK